MGVCIKIFDGASAVVLSDMLSEIQALSFFDTKEQLWSADDIGAMFTNMDAKVIVLSKEEQISQETKPVGFLMWQAVLDEAEILTICILPPYRCQGLGSKMLQALYANMQSNGVMEVFLEVNEHNKAAIMLYAKNGFETVGRRKGYYGTGGQERQDALVMKYVSPPALEGRE